MNAIEMKIIGAVQSGHDLLHHVTHDEDATASIMLHGNRIACVDLDRGIMSLSDQGYLTRTTTSRLNALLEAFAPDYRTRVHQGQRQLVDHREGIARPFGQWVVFRSGQLHRGSQINV